LRIAIMSDLPTISTGYGKIAHYLAKYLMRLGVEVVFFGLQQMGFPVYVKVDGRYVEMYSCHGGAEPYLERCLREAEPDIVIHIRDAFAHTPDFFPTPYRVKPVCERRGVKAILWTPVQSEPVPRQFAEACVNESHLTLVPTSWAKEQLVWTGVPFNHVEILPWGFDPEVYRPVDPRPDKTEFGFSEGAVAIASIGVNDQTRKNWPALLLAFQRVKRRLPEAELLLLTSSGAFHIPHFVDALGLRGSVILPKTYMKEWGVPEEDLVKLYSCLDAYVSLSAAEGFNLPCLEAAACGARVVVSDHPNHREILGDYPQYVRTYRVLPGPWSVDGAADPDDAAEKIISALGSPPGDRAFLEKYRWDSIARRLLEIVRSRGWCA